MSGLHTHLNNTCVHSHEQYTCPSYTHIHAPPPTHTHAHTQNETSLTPRGQILSQTTDNIESNWLGTPESHRRTSSEAQQQGSQKLVPGGDVSCFITLQRVWNPFMPDWLTMEFRQQWHRQNQLKNPEKKVGRDSSFQLHFPCYRLGSSGSCYLQLVMKWNFDSCLFKFLNVNFRTQ